jgi:hypothetical protein
LQPLGTGTGVGRVNATVSGPAVKKAQHLVHYYSVVVVLRVWGYARAWARFGRLVGSPTHPCTAGAAVEGGLNIRSTCRRAGTASVVDSTVASSLLGSSSAALVRLVSLTMAGERRKPVQNGLHRTSSLVLAMPFDPRSARRGGPAAGHACRRPRVPRAWPQQCRLEQHGTRTYSQPPVVGLPPPTDRRW